MTRALIVGSEGQDGRILFDRLTSDGCEVLGIGRQSLRGTGAAAIARIDITSRDAVRAVFREWEPDEIYYLPAVHQASDVELPADHHALLDRSLAIHVSGLSHFLQEMTSRELTCSLFYAASSLVFGDVETDMQDETTPLSPRGIYGITKTAGVHTCRYYRHSHNTRANVGFLYNHESPLRGSSFLSQKIARAAARIAAGSNDDLIVGNLSARTDWGFAPDFVDAMIRIVRQDRSDDYIVATGEAHTVAEFAETAFAHVGLDWRDHVREDRSLLTRQSVTRIGNSERLRDRMGWRPSVSFPEMVRILVDAAGKNDA